MTEITGLTRRKLALLVAGLAGIVAVVIGSVVVASPLKHQDRQIVDAVIDATVGNVAGLERGAFGQERRQAVYQDLQLALSETDLPWNVVRDIESAAANRMHPVATISGEIVVRTVATQLHVPSQFATIQQAINASISGDEILVAPGWYKEVLNLHGRAITIRSDAGADLTTIDGSGFEDSVIKCVTGEGPATVIEGFTITGGTGDKTLFGLGVTVGGGMLNIDSSPRIIACKFIGNTATYNGGGMYNGYHSRPVLVGCTFASNRAEKGAGIYSSNSSVEVTNCSFNSNVAAYGGGAMYNSNDTHTSVTSCQFRYNSAAYNGGAIYDYGSHSSVSDCTFSRNAAHYNGGGMYRGLQSRASMQNCVFLTPNDDIAGSGRWIADSVLVLGACCIGSSCLEVTESACNKAGGTWVGSDSSCRDAQAICPDFKISDINHDGEVNQLDVEILLEDIGNCKIP